VGACSGCVDPDAGIGACPTDVATSAMCPSPGAICCAGAAQWRCGRCLAETCHWFEWCTPAGFDGGGQCSDTVSCPADQVCVSGGTCAVSCTPDGGAGCPAGTTCQSADWYFNPVIIEVCR
jgi:hypothetical protein